jgi:phage shock protein C
MHFSNIVRDEWGLGEPEGGTFSPQSSYPKAKGGTIMYCNACGKDIAEDGRFCSHCGNVVGIRPMSRKLMRSSAERKIAGVCAGLAQYFDLDVSLVRILCFFVTVATGVCPGVVTYLLAWIIVPGEPELKPVVAVQQTVTS